MLRRLLALLFALALIGAACAGSEERADDAAGPLSPTAAEARTHRASTNRHGIANCRALRRSGRPGGSRCHCRRATPAPLSTPKPSRSRVHLRKRILYPSTSASGTDVAVSGFFAHKPDGAPPEGGWPLIAWAHGTVGLGDSCAPSHKAETDVLAAALVSFWVCRGRD